MRVEKQSIGLDISKASFTACVAVRSVGNRMVFSETKSFKNEKQGFNQLLRWVRKQCEKDIEMVFLMEATGVYYEQLAYHLHGLGQQVHVCLANTVKHFAQSLNVKTKTDAVDAKVLAHFGCERTHRLWQPPASIYLKLRDLTRFQVQLQEQKAALGNILHSKEAGHEVEEWMPNSLQELIALYDKQLALGLKQIKKLIAEDTHLQAKVNKLLSLPGVGLITVATILGETFGFEHFHSRKQVVSYAGYDVVEHQSGSVQGRTHISKKGNHYIRRALYFPALSASRFNPVLKAGYLKLIKVKPSKMIGQVAIQRKLLALIYTLWKSDTEYQENYEQLKKEKEVTQAHQPTLHEIGSEDTSLKDQNKKILEQKT